MWDSSIMYSCYTCIMRCFFAKFFKTVFIFDFENIPIGNVQYFGIKIMFG